jgi:antirestriction protein ArdC
MKTPSQIRAEITAQIVAALEQGVIPWRKPWSTIRDPFRLPSNIKTLRPYRGINVLMLQLAASKNAYCVGLWGTFNRWKAIGCNVRKGEKGTAIVFWKPISEAKGSDDDDEPRTFPLLQSWTVFNVAQVQGKAAEPFHSLPRSNGKPTTDDRHEEFEQAIAATEADIRYGGNQAIYYRPPEDFIRVPNREQFVDFPAFAETVLHETCHWSETRLGWTGSYAEGELRAEIGACFLVTALGIPNSNNLTNHAAYIQS